MKPYLVLVPILACLCVGCGDDQSDLIISKTISTLRDTTSTIEQVKALVNDALSQAKKDNKSLAPEKIVTATEKAGDLKRLAKVLHQLKAATDSRKESLTAEQRKESAKRHKSDFESAMIAIDAAQKELAATLNEADAAAAAIADNSEKAIVTTALAELKKELKKGQSEFEVLTKTQS